MNMKNIGIDLSRRIVARCEAMELKGKKRDDATLNLWIGAIHGAHIAGNAEIAGYLERVAVMVICVRGFSEVKHMAAQEFEPAEKVAS